MPFTLPEGSIDAMAVFALLHEPPADELPSRVEAPSQRYGVPVITAGSEFTVNAVVA